MGYVFAVPYPEIEQVRRCRPGHVHPGDWAAARLAPGMMQLLETRIPGHGAPIGAGYKAPYTVPFGLAATAAYAVLQPLTEAGVQWTGRDLEIEWHAAPKLSDALAARAELLSLDERRAQFRISATAASDRVLLSGTLQLSSQSSRRAQTSRPAEESQPGTAFRSAGNAFLRSVRTAPQVRLGSKARMLVSLENRRLFRAEVTASIALPFGNGFSLESPAQVSVSIGRFSRAEVEFVVRADRPHEVNLAKPWPLTVIAVRGGKRETIVVPISVPDPEPPTVFYVLTEDCETFDGGPLTGDYGANASLGNANNFMDPEDYRIQMIDKPNRMNAIADEFGAKWTHFWCATQRFAADWARRQSSTGRWDSLAEDLDSSVMLGCDRHEYAPHIHFDYEPDSSLPPQPRLRYDAETDGILPRDYYDPQTNPRHAYHDWDGSSRGIDYVKALGDLDDGDSKAGSLRKSTRYLARLQAGRRYPLLARTGGFDFGKDPEDQRISTEAYRMNRLAGNSDAAFAADQLPAANSLYWCQEQDRSLPVEHLTQANLVQLAVSMQTDFLDTDALNAWFTRNLERMDGPGVRVLTAMTHAMFMRGEPDSFRGLSGGSFDGLQRHLEYVARVHPRVRFATASEALVEYLDYHTPALGAYVLPALLKGDDEGTAVEHQVRLLGCGIRLDQERPATLRCALPPHYDANEVEWMALIGDDGAVMGECRPAGCGSRPEIIAVLKHRPRDLRLRLKLRRDAGAGANAWADAAAQSLFLDRAEPERGPLLRFTPPHDGAYSLDILRFLMNPAAGGEEPLGRRLHPLGCYSIGISLSEALGEGKEFQPCKLKLRWRKFPPDTGGLHAAKREEDSASFICITDEEGDCVAESEINRFESFQARRASISTGI